MGPNRTPRQRWGPPGPDLRRPVRGGAHGESVARHRRAADTCRGGGAVPCRPEDRHALGEGRQAQAGGTGRRHEEPGSALPRPTDSRRWLHPRRPDAGQPDLENISYTGVISKYGWGLPSPSKNDVTFLEQRSGPELKIGPNESLYFGPSLEGGGVYAGRSTTIEGSNTMNTYFLKSMSSPSPYTLFWSDYRPIYCIGTILGELSSMSTDSSIKVDKKTSNVIMLVKAVQQNPIFVLGDEQLQLLDRIIETATDSVYGVNRGVNNSDVSKHEAGSMMKIVPYKNLGIPELDKIASKCVQ